MSIDIIVADITTLAVDAIVDAANEVLAPGGGVDGAIRRAAGPEINEATRRIGRCPTGTAVITPGFRLPARFVIFTAGPMWQGGVGQHAKKAQLASCYRSSLAVAAANKIETIAFPSISTGIFGFPIEQAAPIAIGACLAHLQSGGTQRITMCCFAEGDAAHYRAALTRATSRS